MRRAVADSPDRQQQVTPYDLSFKKLSENRQKEEEEDIVVNVTPLRFVVFKDAPKTSQKHEQDKAIAGSIVKDEGDSSPMPLKVTPMAAPKIKSGVKVKKPKEFSEKPSVDRPTSTDPHMQSVNSHTRTANTSMMSAGRLLTFSTLGSTIRADLSRHEKIIELMDKDSVVRQERSRSRRAGEPRVVENRSKSKLDQRADLVSRSKSHTNLKKGRHASSTQGDSKPGDRSNSKAKKPDKMLILPSKQKETLEKLQKILDKNKDAKKAEQQRMDSNANTALKKQRETSRGIRERQIEMARRRVLECRLEKQQNMERSKSQLKRQKESIAEKAREEKEKLKELREQNELLSKERCRKDRLIVGLTYPARSRKRREDSSKDS